MVYVDNMIVRFKNKKFCHLFADTIEELHQMADKIKVKRIWFQTKNKKFPHYDISLSKKKLAIQNGAKEISYRQLPEFVERIEKIK